MYSIKATRMHVKNGASLSTPSPAIHRSTIPESLNPTPTSFYSAGYDSALGDDIVTSKNSQHARVSPIKSLMDTGSTESTPQSMNTLQHVNTPQSVNEQRSQVFPAIDTNSSTLQNSTFCSKGKTSHSQRSHTPDSSNYFDRRFDFTYSSSDLDHSPCQKDPSTPPMRNSDVSDMTTPPSSATVSPGKPASLNTTNSFNQSPTLKIPSPVHKTKSVKITITKQRLSPPQLKKSIIQSPTRVRTSPTAVDYTTKKIPLFYSPLLMRQLKQQEDEKNQRSKEKTYFTSYKGSAIGGSSSSTNSGNIGYRKSSPFSCLNPVDDCFPETPPSSSTEELLYKSSNSSLLLNKYDEELFLDLGESIFDPPPSSELMTHENRWKYQSNLAGLHKQDLHTLDLSHRIYSSPISLLYGVPPQAASMITTLKYNAINLDQYNLSFLLELMGRNFPKLTSLSIQISQAILIQDDDPSLIIRNTSGIVPDRHLSYDGSQIVTDLHFFQKQRIYILLTLPQLSIINDVPVTDAERRGILSGVIPLSLSMDKNRVISNILFKNLGQLQHEGVVNELSSSCASAFSLNPNDNPTEEPTNKSRTISVDAVEEDDSTVHQSASLLCLIGRSYSWSYSDLSDQLDLRLCHSVDDIDLSTNHKYARAYRRRQHSLDSSLSDLSDRVMKIQLNPTVKRGHDTTLPERSSRQTAKSKSHLRNMSFSSASTINDDATSEESSSLGNQLQSSSHENNYFSSTDSRADSPKLVQLRIKNIEDQYKYRNHHDSENDSCTVKNMSNRFEHNDDAAAAKRKFTRIKKDCPLPPTSPASMPRAPASRVKKQKRKVTISNMETLRKVKPIADKMFDDDDNDEQLFEEQESFSQFDRYSSVFNANS